MSKVLIYLLAVPVILVLLLFVLFVVTMRMKYRPVQDRVRRFARDVGNPKVLKMAGQPGAETSIIRHVGRTSGAAYQTPLEAVETGDGFVIALPYGTSSDWLKNVVAAGSAVLVRDGVEHQVDRPELVPFAVGNPYFSRSNQVMHRIFGVDQFLLLRRVEPD